MDLLACYLCDVFASALGSPPHHCIPAPAAPQLTAPQLTGADQFSSAAAAAPPSAAAPSFTIYQYAPEPAYALQLYLRALSLPCAVVNVPSPRLLSGSASYPLLVGPSPDPSCSCTAVASPIPGSLDAPCAAAANPHLAPPASPGRVAPPPYPSVPSPAPLLHLRNTTTDLTALAVSSSPPLSSALLLRSSLLHSTVSPLLLALRYADPAGYRSLRSLRCPPGLPGLLPRLRLLAEKISALRSLPPSVLPLSRPPPSGFLSLGWTRPLDVPLALHRLRLCYDVLDSDLRSSATPWILGTERMTSYDAEVFGHLAAALETPSACAVLGGYASILRWFVRVADRHFRDGKDNAGGTLGECAAHARARLAELEGGRGGEDVVDYEGIERAIRGGGEAERRRAEAGRNLMRVRYGASMVGDGKGVGAGGGEEGGAGGGETPQQRRQREKKSWENQVWIATVGTATVAFMLFSGRVRVK
ncbi:hypothetical protein TeGR_g9478 [Tetraparma gracilis]|uniref:Mitochondrial outer membrane transport complex Sam37/metaxin N-terminal domain-containing protein n=1 Tax=Tetraparma gracilis TaxID=2962635 RepID=A0ABQ6N809_9STRA|nr:hypothetical protein TeGR_g9478 [Tetraparma gracilis]